MIRRRVAVLAASAALHHGALALLLVIAGLGASSAILIDLRPESDEVGDARSAPRAAPASLARSKRPAAIGFSRPGPSNKVAPASAPRPAPVSERQRAADAGPVAAAPNLAPSPPAVSPPATPAPAPPGPARPAPAAPLPGGPGSTEALPLATDAGAAGPLGHVARADRSAAPSSKGGADGTGAAGRTDRSGAGTSRGETGWAAALGAAGEGQGGLPPEYGPYLERFRRRLAESMHYPLAARRQGLAGTVEIEVLVDPSGRIAEARVIASSSHAILDEAALDTVKRLPTEPFPDRLPRRPLRIRLPLAFELQ